MNYIVFDLEWNQSTDGKDAEHPLLPFEIIEIGAQKLNEQFVPIGTFHEIIKPIVYQKLHPCTKEVIGITEKELMHGKSFHKAGRDFLSFCGKEYIFATWGSMDLTEFQRNLYFFQLDNQLPFPLFYCDVQKLFSIAFEDGKTRRSLEHAVEALQLPLTETFHRADHDALYTAQILKHIRPELIKSHFSVDYYRTPDSKKEELHLHYPDYYKYVSRKFASREEAMADKTVTALRCNICGRALRKKIRWFSGNNRIFYALAECPEHGYLKGKLRIKKSDCNAVFAVKTVKMTDAAGAEKIRNIQEEMRKKHRERAERSEN